MLTNAEKDGIRRHLGYAALNHGAGPSPYFASEMFQYSQSSNFLEQRLDQLTPITEARITGKVIGVIAFVGNTPAPGSVYSVSFTSVALFGDDTPVTVGPITVEQDDTRAIVAGRLTEAIQLDSVLVSAGIFAGGPYGPGLSQRDIVNPEVEIFAPKAFTMSVTTSGVALAISQQGAHVDPMVAFGGGASSGGYCSDPDSSVVYDPYTYGFIPILDKLHNLIGESSQRAHIASTEGFRKTDEIKERRRIYDIYRKALKDLLGVEYGSLTGMTNAFIT